MTDGFAERKRLFQGLMQQALSGAHAAVQEAAHADEIAAEQTRRERLPRLVLLDFVLERQRRRLSEPVLITCLMKYVFLLWSDEAQVFVAEVPELPGCMAHGDTQEAWPANAKEAIQLWIETAQEFGDPRQDLKVGV